MAGNYPDPPGFRIPWTMDGSVLVGLNRDSGRGGLRYSSGYASGGILLGNIEASKSDMDGPLGNEQSSTVGLSSPGSSSWGSVGDTNQQAGSEWAIVFPRPMTLTGIRLNSGIGVDTSSSTVSVWVSEDTTNGEDGTWVQKVDHGVGDNASVDARQFTAFAASNVRGVRFYVSFYSAQAYGSSLNAPVLLYGYYPTSGNRLEAWSPTADERLNPVNMDFGDVPRSSSSDKSFRVKNLSTSLTAKDVQVSLVSTRATTPPVAEQFVMSTDGLVWTPGLALGDLAPGSFSDVIQLRRITPSNAALGPWAIRIDALANQGWE